MRRSLFVVVSTLCMTSIAFVPAEARADEVPTVPTVPTAPAPITTSATPAPTPAPSAATAVDHVTVELRANDTRATLERRKSTQTFSGLALPDLAIGGLTEWETVCVAPCVMPVSTRATYRVAGDGLVPSSTFALPRTPHLRLDADLGSSRSRVSGALLTLAGAGALVLGTGAAITSPILAANDVGSDAVHTGLLAGGVGTASVGALLVAVGVTLWITNDSSLRFDPTPAPGASAKAPRGHLLVNGFTF